MTTNKGQFRFCVIELFTQPGWVEEHEVAAGEIDDPFITTTTRPKGWRAAWAVLRGRYRLRVTVNGTPAAYRVVFGSDYTPPVRGPVDHATVDMESGEEPRG